MQRFSFITLCLICCGLLTTTSCRKKGKDLTEVTFTNQIGEAITLDIYPTLADYGNNTSAAYTTTIAAYATITLPGTTFKPGQNYYMDWYSKNHFYSNWYNDMYKNDISYVAIEPKEGHNSYYMTPTFSGSKQAVFLDTFATSTHWKAVDVYQYSATTGYVSVWDATPLAGQYREITVRKNFTASFSYKDDNGVVQNEELNFKVQESKEAYIEFMDAAGSSLGSMVAGRLPTGVAPDYQSDAIDTVMALLPHSEYSYMMVRQ